MNSIISVVITTYKREMAILERALKSVLAQTYRPIEIILVNDCPECKNDVNTFLQERFVQSFKELQNAGCEIRVLHNDKNMGACYSRNRGIEIAQGEFIALLDDDDEWVPEKLSEQMSAMKDDISLVYCNAKAVFRDDKISKLDFIYDCSDNPIRELLKKNCVGGCSFPLIRKKSIIAVGGFDPNFKSSQDYDLWIRIAKKEKLAYIDKPLVIYYIMESSITSNFSNRKQGYDKLLEKYRDLFREYPGSQAAFYSNVIQTCIKEKQMKYAGYYFKRSFDTFPRNMVIFLDMTKVICRKILKIHTK